MDRLWKRLGLTATIAIGLFLLGTACSKTPTTADFTEKDPLAPSWNRLFYPPRDYKYFHDAANRANPQPRDGWIVDAAILAYGRRGDDKDGSSEISAQEAERILKTEGGFSSAVLCENWSDANSGARWFFASNDNWAILAFRGTQKGDIRDLVTDLLAFMNATTGNPLSLKTPRSHQGFTESLEKPWPSIARLLNEYRDRHPNAEIVFTGHSLGGGLATVAASKWQSTHDARLSLVTFGCPRVGNAPFNDLVRNRVGRWTRYVDGDDIVTHVPLNGAESFGYVHDENCAKLLHALNRTKEEFLLESELVGQTLVRTSVIPSAALADHSPGRYLYYVWAAR